MKEKYFIITVDTEGDNLWSFTPGKAINTENAKYINRFQRLCDSFSFKPVYLTNYEMACSDIFVKESTEWLTTNRCEIGLHLHAWNNPPIVDDGVPVATNEKDNTAKDYTTYLFGVGAIQMASAPVQHPSEISRVVLTAGGYDLLATRLRETLHPNGFSYTLPTAGGGSIVSSPTDAQLGAAAQWKVVTDPKNIAIARLISNG